jgi:flagellin
MVTSAATANTQLTAVESALSAVTNYAAVIGSTQNRMTSSNALNMAITTNYANGVSALVDADMNQASTRLQALQTQQQLGIQSLSIANQSSQLILKLFQ